MTVITPKAAEALRKNSQAMALMVLRFDVHPRTLQNWTAPPFNEMLAHPDAVRIIRENCKEFKTLEPSLADLQILQIIDADPIQYHEKLKTA